MSRGSCHSPICDDTESTAGINNRVFSYGPYDRDGNLLELGGPDGQPTNLTYTDRGELYSIARDNMEVTLHYDEAGRVEWIDYDNGTRIDYEYDDANRLTQIRHSSGQSDLLVIDYAWTINDWVATRTVTDYTVSPATETVVAFDYDNRGRLISEERVVDSTTTTYDLAYTYDQLGNRQTKYDAVTELRTEYTYDVELDPNDPNMAYATHNNRLLYYEVYDGDPNDPNTMLLRTVSYTYYDDGDVSNITIKDEDPNGTSDPAYDRHRDLALYYNADKSLRVALWDSWELNQYGNPTDYDPNCAHEFRYDGPLARYADAFYDELYAGQDPNRWPLDQTVSWSEHVGETIYNDGQLTREEDPNNPGEFLFDFTEQLHYIGPQAQESVATGDLRYSHGDLIDSTMLTTDDYGAAASSVRYTAFGEILDANGSPGGEPPTGFPRYQYAGGWGYESGLLKLYGVNPNLPPITLQHLGHRWYQPDIGRFVQRDPLGILAGRNLYAYVHQQPTDRIDPSGLYPLPFALGNGSGSFLDDWGWFVVLRSLTIAKAAASRAAGHAPIPVLGPAVTIISCVKMLPDLTRIYAALRQRQKAINDTTDPRDFLDNWPPKRPLF